jgi:hypothetical protein
VKDISKRCCTNMSWKQRGEWHNIYGFKAHFNEFLLSLFYCTDIMSTSTQMGLYVTSQRYPGRLRWGGKKNTMNLLSCLFLSRGIFVSTGSGIHFTTFDCSHPAFFLQVRFVCSEPTVLISSIKEISSCKYVVTIQSPMLCKNP